MVKSQKGPLCLSVVTRRRGSKGDVGLRVY